MCMYVYIYIYMYLCMCVHMYMHIYIFVFFSTHCSTIKFKMHSHYLHSNVTLACTTITPAHCL